jgi:Ser/Thr protein kinase RdoA (MazF antagonist)
VRDLLEATRTVEVPLQPCIRDVWHDHILFTGDRVTGLVDFDAMGSGSVAGDVARLLGSLAGDNASLWSIGLEAYGSLRPLSDVEQTLLTALDRSGVILAALNWVEWLYRERREFPNAAAVANRLDELLPRLKTLSESPTGRSAAPAALWLPRLG